MNKKVGGGGVSFFGLLTAIFIALKLTNFIAWSWFWVLSPLVLPILIGIVIGLLSLMGLGILALVEGMDKDENKDNK